VTERSLRDPVTVGGETKPAISRHLAKDPARPLAQTRHQSVNQEGK
jgi:hypothetical protein